MLYKTDIPVHLLFPLGSLSTLLSGIYLLFHEIRVRLLEDATHDSESASFFSPAGAKNSSHVRCSSAFVKHHQALSHSTGEGNLHSQIWVTKVSLGLSGLFLSCARKQIHTDQSYVPPCQTHPEIQWDEEEPSPGKARYWLLSMPHQQTQPETRHNPCHHYTPVSFSQRKLHCPGHRDMVSHCFLSATAGRSSSEWLGLTWTHGEINDISSPSQWFTTQLQGGDAPHSLTVSSLISSAW